ncbi:MAG: pyruvate dehydrogenase (acetyl-transferring) E1 component subunit alpha [Candidatus Aminicenantes bacterium]|jgi:pyruvate dehydrogenase E1 component alpha subunit|nr:pyruvate dehydrogenase (acetyl-transferring) E1 component subunit alpha [Candidatus Aminicenantes bacterium]
MIELFDPLKGERLRVLDETGEAAPGLDPGLPDAELRAIYERMLRTRTADAKALKLQRQGRLGTYPPSRGHEACQVGLASAMGRDDWFFPYFRDLGMYITLGYPLADYYHLWMGNEAGLRTPDGLNIYPIAIPVGSQIPQAVGAGLAAKYRKLRIAVVTTFGDGATSEGDFHEGLNFAGVFRTPNVFVCLNNQFAISVPRARQTAAATIAQKAVAYGFPGVQVDGNDVLAVYAAAREALANARSGQGPTLIEAYTYRMGDHTTSDDAARYRSKEEVQEWERRDPILRFRLYLGKKGLWDEAYEKTVQESAAEFVEKAVAEAEARPAATPEDLFTYTYAAMPPELEAQLAELKAFLGEGRR